MPLDGLQNIILKDLGYEDEDEFEDALGGTFMQVCARRARAKDRTIHTASCAVTAYAAH